MSDRLLLFPGQEPPEGLAAALEALLFAAGAPVSVKQLSEVLEGMLKAVPLRRAAEPREIYLALKFIVECDYFTGRCIDVDGGISI